MAEESSQRQIISSSSWWLWLLLAIGAGIILLIIWGAWRLWRGATRAVREETEVIAQPNRQDTSLRFVRTDTKIILIDDPIIPEGETAVEAIEDKPEHYLGHEVTVSGSVTDFQNVNFFSVVQSEGTVGVMGLDGVIQVNDLETNTNPENAMVRVTGIVKELTKEREKTEFGLELKNLDEAFWQDRIVIEATKIRVIPATTT